LRGHFDVGHLLIQVGTSIIAKSQVKAATASLTFVRPTAEARCEHIFESSPAAPVNPFGLAFRAGDHELVIDLVCRNFRVPFNQLTFEQNGD
jgi:hypothetical protein